MPERAEPVMSNAPTFAGRSSAACTAVALFLSRYAGSVVAKNTAPGTTELLPSATRPASTPMVVVSSS